jgi:lysophospholipase L1-like esterase
MRFHLPVQWLAAVLVTALSAVSIVPCILAGGAALLPARSALSRFPQQVKFTGDGDDQNRIDQLDIRALRPDAKPDDQSAFAEATVNQLAAGAAPTADQPTPRLDQNSQLAHAQLLEKARKGRIDIYFEGDSITRRWGTSDEQYKDFLANWRQNFFGWNAADFGWGGDTTQNILWRLHNGELDNVNPKIIVVMAGTNNVGKLSPEGSKDPRVADISRGIKAILNVCRQKAPKATIVLMGITPRNDNLAVMPIINQINANIAKFADGKKVRYLNINNRLADKEGKLFEGMANRDGLHLDVKGYQVWADALKPIFTELLGPPAKEDHAPPPTGDPSAAKRPSG